eukprot:395038_1
MLVGWVLALIFLICFIVAATKTSNSDSNGDAKNNCDKTTTQSPSTNSPSMAPTTSPVAKNLIIIIGDGMGSSYNTAYRSYKNLSKTILDEHFKGRYSTMPAPNTVDSDGTVIPDSSAGGSAFSGGVQTKNGMAGTDAYGNPVGSILAAAKRQGKGTGVISNKRLVDATPAAFTSHVLSRYWQYFISKQQAMTQYNGKPMIDLMLGGGRKFWDSWEFTTDKTIQSQYGWNTVTNDSESFLSDLRGDSLTGSQLPYMGLFADYNFPYYLDRLNGHIYEEDLDNIGASGYPDLKQMSEGAIKLLSDAYSDEGFFLMVEASEIDHAGHHNDIVALLWDMEELMITTDYIIDWAKQNGETLVVILADHETGGVSMGRDGSYNKTKWIKYRKSKGAKDDNVADAWGSYQYDYGIPSYANINGINGIANQGAYMWYPESIKTVKHTALWFGEEMNITISNLQELYDDIEMYYLGDKNPQLTQKEKKYLKDMFDQYADFNDPDPDDIAEIIANIMSIRTLTGWNTHSHTGVDCSVAAYGVNSDMFKGHFINSEIGQILSKAFGVEKEQM